MACAWWGAELVELKTNPAVSASVIYELGLCCDCTEDQCCFGMQKQ